MEILGTLLPGCHVLRQPRFEDARGWLRKGFQANDFASMGLRTDWVEDFCSASRPGVLRGMHFQIPPSGHAKLVACLTGRVLDVVLDLRLGPTYGAFASLELSAEASNALYISEGIAHGFLALDACTMAYKTTAVHDPGRDGGIRWDGFGFPWPVEAPFLSMRDQSFPALAEFITPWRSNL